jgi:condensin complex subunit 2
MRIDVATPAGAAAAGGSKPAKSAKAPFTIDFTSPSTEATSSKTLFAPASRGTISFAASSKASSARRSSSKKASTGGDAAKKRKDEWLLPDDMHFSSRQLLRLFLKPKFAVSGRDYGTGYTTLFGVVLMRCDAAADEEERHVANDGR